MPNTFIYQCSDGHLYTASPIKAILLSIHLGIGRHFQRCPVDGRWRISKRLDRNDLTDQQLQEAQQHSF